MAQASLLRRIVGFTMHVLRNLLNRLLINLAWFASEFLGWPAALAVLPPMLYGKVALVSGANSGIGLETTKALIKQGASVVMGCRNLDKAKRAIEDIAASQGQHVRERLIPVHLDLEDFASIKAAAGQFRTRGLPLHILVNNAGIHLFPPGMATHGFERTMAADYFGHAYLTELLLDRLRESAPSRVVSMSSTFEALGLFGLYSGRIPWDDLKGSSMPDSGERPYTLSKTFILMYSKELAQRLQGTGVDVFCVHPGFVDSGWYDKVDRQRYLISWFIWNVVKRAWPWAAIGQGVKTGALSTIYAAISPELQGLGSTNGTMHYFGPSYILSNWFNTSMRWTWNPWVHVEGACRRLYNATQDILTQVDKDINISVPLSTNAAAPVIVK